MNDQPIAAGKSSFDLIDRDVFFREIDLPEGAVILDAACGSGRYSRALSPHAGEKGLIYAVDLWEEGIRSLETKIGDEGITNIRPMVGDLARLSLEDISVDVALLATVLHDLVRGGDDRKALAEIRRVMRPAGLLYVLEFKKVDGPPGPPRKIRLSREELNSMTEPFGFVEVKSLDTGPVTYLSVFRIDKTSLAPVLTSPGR